jgi:hypothetical protein
LQRTPEWSEKIFLPIFSENWQKIGEVAHECNASYSEGWCRRVSSSKPVWESQ